MAVPHIRVELRGTTASGAEVWSCGFSTAPPVGGGLADVESLALEAAVTFANNFFSVTAVNSAFGTATRFTSTRVQQLEADGSVRATAESILGTPVVGSATTSLPTQCAVVVSLRSPTAGARGRGRMYLPNPAASALQSNGRLTTTVRDALAVNMRSAMNIWNGLADTEPVGVASAAGGFVTTVNKIQVGDVVDTQRRRRDALPESYYTTDL